MNKVLIDTNAYSELLRGDRKVLEIISQADLVFASIFVLGELYAGFKGGNKEKENNQYLNQFLRKPSVELLIGTKETAIIFSELKHELKKAGTPIPINDIWIAAHAIETGSLLITYDHHFQNLKGLRIWGEF